MFSDMKPAEKRLLEACQKGEVLDLGNERPKVKIDDNEIRGEFLRTLILSDNQEIEESNKKYILKIDPKGIRFSGVYISGIFDFSFCSTDLPFKFENSIFDKKIDMSNSKLKYIKLDGSEINELYGQSLICDSDFCLKNKFKAKKEINLDTAIIRENLELTDGVFENINLSRVEVGKSLFLNSKFIAKGDLNLKSSKIGGSLYFSGGKFKTIESNKIWIGGSVFLRDGFEASGEVNFHSCFIGKSFIFSNSNKIASLILNSAQISRLNFDISNVKNIDLDGCVYEHLNSIIFSQLVEKMPKEDNFKPQPYKQLAKVLRNMGHNEDANNIMIKYNDELRKKDFLTCDRLFISILKWIYGKTAGYGYKPMKVLGTMFIVWFFCSLFYWKASSVAVFAPSNPLIFQYKDYKVKIADEGTAIGDFFNSKDYKCTDDTIECNNWTNSKLLDEEYTTFNPFMYSLDVILPIVDLQVEKDWGQYVSSNNGTLNDFTRWLMWFEILFGWIYSLILVAILSGLAKNEKD